MPIALAALMGFWLMLLAFGVALSLERFDALAEAPEDSRLPTKE